MKIKNLITLVLAGVMCVSLSACSTKHPLEGMDALEALQKVAEVTNNQKSIEADFEDYGPDFQDRMTHETGTVKMLIENGEITTLKSLGEYYFEKNPNATDWVKQSKYDGESWFSRGVGGGPYPFHHSEDEFCYAFGESDVKKDGTIEKAGDNMIITVYPKFMNKFMVEVDKDLLVKKMVIDWEKDSNLEEHGTYNYTNIKYNTLDEKDFE